MIMILTILPHFHWRSFLTLKSNNLDPLNQLHVPKTITEKCVFVKLPEKTRNNLQVFLIRWSFASYHGPTKTQPALSLHCTWLHLIAVYFVKIFVNFCEHFSMQCFPPAPALHIHNHDYDRDDGDDDNSAAAPKTARFTPNLFKIKYPIFPKFWTDIYR